MATGDITVIEHEGIVGASRDNPDEMRAAMSAPDSVEPETLPPTPPVETPPTDEAPDAPKDAATTTPERDEQGKFTKPPVAPAQKKKESIQAEIDRLTYTRREEERRLERIRTERERVEAQPPTKPAEKPVAPTGNTFKAFVNDYAAKNPEATYEDAIDAYNETFASQIIERFKSQSQQDEANKQVQTLIQAHNTRQLALMATIPEWSDHANRAQQVIEANGFKTLPLVLDHAIIRSDKSEYILHDLITHHDALLQLAREASELPMTAAAVNLMRTVLESRLSNNGSSPAPRSGPGEAPRQSQAKAPPKPVGATPSASSESGEESYEQSQAAVRRILYPNRK